jgi:hypothetical protein
MIAAQYFRMWIWRPHACQMRQMMTAQSKEITHTPAAQPQSNHTFEILFASKRYFVFRTS